MTLLEFMDKFPNQEDAYDYFVKIVYPQDIVCPHCGAIKEIYRRKKRYKMFKCRSCNNEFSVLKDTIFERTTTDLRLWFYAIWQILSSRKGYSALQLQRQTGVTYKTAWRMLQQIRIAMANEIPKPFKGINEMDETYVGGKEKVKYVNGEFIHPKKGRGTTKKPVIGIVNRNTQQVYSVVATRNEKGQKLSGQQLLDVIDDRCLDGSLIMTDDFRPYNILDKKAKDRYNHETVCHSEHIYSNGNGIHTNSIESNWAILKRGHYGVYHHFSEKYLPMYTKEYDFRYNNRDIGEAFDKVLKQSILNPRCVRFPKMEHINAFGEYSEYVYGKNAPNTLYLIRDKDAKNITEEEHQFNLELAQLYKRDEEYLWMLNKKKQLNSQYQMNLETGQHK